MRLSDLLGRHDPARPALEEGGRRLTWGEYRHAVTEVAEGLPIRAGDRVALVLPRSLDLLIAILAVWHKGAVAVPLDVESPRPEREGLLAHADPRAVWTLEGVHARDAAHVGPDGDALVLYTSGSTGTPKGVRHTHESILASLEGVRDAFGLDEDSRVLSGLSLTASHGLFMHGLAHLVHGGTLRLAAPLGAFTARAFLAELEGATFTSLVPPQAGLLASVAERPLPRGLTVACASAPLHGDTAAAFAERLGTPLRDCFGMTETAGWCLYEGRATRVEVRLQDGEMQLRGPQVSPGYWRGEDTGEWLRTGDLAEVQDGRFRIVGRSKRTIHHLGRSVQPEEVEAALAALPGVQEAVVAGIAHSIYGEAPKAWVVQVPGANLDPAALREALRERLAPWRLPRWIEVVPDLPRTRTGKPDLRRLTHDF